MHPTDKPNPADPITIRPLARDDFSLLQRWLTTAHVQTWWRGEPATPDDIAHKYGPRVDGLAPTRVFVIQTAGHPVGIIQCYRHTDHPDWNRAVGIHPAAGIDYLIGEPDQLGRGIGSTAIASFTQHVFALYPEIDTIVAAPQADNHASRRALEKAGFALHGERHLDSDDPSDTGPSAIYTLARLPGTLRRHGPLGDDHHHDPPTRPLPSQRQTTDTPRNRRLNPC
jgi:RimJ/RimL family protein N-acetyltransferase